VRARDGLLKLGVDVEGHLRVGRPTWLITDLTSKLSATHRDRNVVRRRLVRCLCGSGGKLAGDGGPAGMIGRRAHDLTDTLARHAPTYRMRDHRARLATLRAGFSHPREPGENSRSQLETSHGL
jgi:hypothetical protein